MLYQINTSFLEEKSLTRLIKPLPVKQNAWIQACQRNFLQINNFSNAMVMKQKLKLTLYKQKPLEEL